MQLTQVTFSHTIIFFLLSSDKEVINDTRYPDFWTYFPPGFRTMLNLKMCFPDTQHPPTCPASNRPRPGVPMLREMKFNPLGCSPGFRITGLQSWEQTVHNGD